MSIERILLLVAAAIIIRLATRNRNRVWLLFAASIVGVYWLQSPLSIRYLDFWLPTTTLGLVVISWVLVRPDDIVDRRDDRIAFLILAGLVLLVASTRHISLDGILTASRPPREWQVVLALLFITALVVLIVRNSPQNEIFISLTIVFIVAILIVMKLPLAGEAASRWLRFFSGQSMALANTADIRWLGYSYIAFRLIHTMRDSCKGRLPSVSLSEYVVYVLFFPAVTAGPIDRLPRFIKDLRGISTDGKNLDTDILNAAPRLLLGMFKKFVLADTLALAALNSQNALQVKSAGWMWVLVYAYSFQIFFDFSGYTDIAIGLGQILGIKMPENFRRPYLKTNLTQFWNSWHITLTQWFRTYFFNPLTRSLRKSRHNLPAWGIILFTQVSTMVLIGLWHGITWNFVLWGLWHGAGLFFQNRWSEWSSPKLARMRENPRLHFLANGISILVTFHFVAIGWVWFALPRVETSLIVFRALIDFGGK